MTTKQQREEWARLAEAATPGPWRVGNVDTDRIFIPWREVGNERVLLIANQHFEHAVDLRFIAASREAVPALLDENARLRAALRGLCDRPLANDTHAAAMALLGEP